MPSGEAGGDADAMTWLSDDKHADLLPVPWLSDRQFEDFTEALLKAQPSLGAHVRHVAHVERWGVPGNKQDGIDLFGHFNDRTSAAWQCKHLDRLRPFEVREAVEAVTFERAEELYLVYARIAKKGARQEMLQHEGWTLLDRRDLTDIVRQLPTYLQRDLLERFWGPQVRRHFLEAPEDGFISLASLREARRNSDAVINDKGALVGRTTELASLSVAFDREGDVARQIILVVGPGGRGKSRLVVEALTARESAAPTIPIACLTPQRTLAHESLRELRPQPSIVFIDDAHNDPDALAPLLRFLRQTPSIQLVLGTRPSARSAIEGRIALAEFWPDEYTTVEVGELQLADARRLVKGVAGDLGLSLGFRNYLAGQAVHSPHVAVIAANLIRRSEFSAAPDLDGNLRRLVLDRYREYLLPGNIDGIESPTLQRVIATYALLGPVPHDDEGLKTRIAEFCHLQLHELAGLLRKLLDRGIVVNEGDALRVVPDLLADRVSEMTAVVENYPTGFVQDLWSAFGTDQYHRLALSLGDLDWRLRAAGAPSVMEPVWEAIRERLRSPYVAQVCEDLDRMGQLAATQPNEVVDALDDLRTRLDQEDADGQPARESPDEAAASRALRLRPLDRDDVRAKLPKLYARAAASNPDLLERSLDALWFLRQRDRRATNPNPDHPERVVTDELLNLIRLPDRSFPSRVVARAAIWIEQAAGPEAASPKEEPGRDSNVTPLFVLKPLLVKEGLETVQTAFAKLEFRPHLISSDFMRPIRDEIRALLRKTGASDDLRLAGVSVELLREALKQPHGYFGNKVEPHDVLLWEADDLATIETLAHVASTTPSAVIRRHVRDQVSWSAEHAESVLVQHAALQLIASIDAHQDVEDLLAEALLHGSWNRSLERVAAVPTLDELKAAREREHARTQGLTEEEASASQMTRIRASLADRESRVARRNADLAERVISRGDIPGTLTMFDATARAAWQIKRDRYLSLRGLWDEIEKQDPTLLPLLASELATMQPGPLDGDLDDILEFWSKHDEAAVLSWVNRALRDGRTDVRLAIASAFSRFSWFERGAGHVDAWNTGMQDEDETVAQAFLGAAGALLKSDPGRGAGLVLANNISAAAATRALENACEYDGKAFGAQLDPDAATSIFSVMTRAGLDSHVVQELLSGIAQTHPRIALDYLVELSSIADEWPRLPDDVYGLADAFEAQADQLADWVTQHLSGDRDAMANLATVLECACGDRLGPHVAQALQRRCSDLSGEQLQGLVEALGALQWWGLHHPALAEDLFARARATGTFEAFLESFRYSGLRIGAYGWVNGVSEEVDELLRTAQAAAQQAHDDVLSREYIAAAARLQAIKDELASRHARDTDEDW